MITYFKKAESQPGLLQTTLEYDHPATTTYNTQPRTPLAEALVLGQSYGVGDLIRKMIEFSDNNARSILFENIEKKYINKTYLDLGLAGAQLEDDTQLITVKQYATFFGILFNASYLTKKNSQTALEYGKIQ